MKEREIRKLLHNFAQRVGVDDKKLFGFKPQVEVATTQFAEVVVINGKPLLARARGVIFPTLAFDEIITFLPKVVVDMGAVPYICNGANVMAPGVVRIEGKFDKGNLVAVVDERHGKALAIGIALFPSQTMRTLKHGKVVKSVHYVGDKLWNALKTFSGRQKV